MLREGPTAVSNSRTKFLARNRKVGREVREGKLKGVRQLRILILPANELYPVGLITIEQSGWYIILLHELIMQRAS